MHEDFPFLFRCFVFLGMFFVTCPPRKVHGLDESDVGPFATCAGGCHCDNVESQPVCSMVGMSSNLNNIEYLNSL